ncbi:MAG: D-glycero-beta-D-manno-heptose-7-phosphate kinase [Deltaproteobacteria bacterium]|jgi:D-beta-D-heptose 7-phosphate kinase/D-beta-D-heptose 1-phosphate adenosyltransferase|nr:D-glycero-beta-D-manno-heptose-7-phosphate kinase [Deltaproteobacteria bacterium]
MTRALELLAQLPQAQVLCLGDLMLDRYIYGSADRLSPEAPVPVVRVQSRKIMPGGLGNVAKNLAALGVKVLSIGLIGDDPAGVDLTRLMTEALKPQIPVFLKDPTRPTTVKTRLIAGIQQVVRYDEESDAPITGSLADQYRAEVARSLPRVGAVALSDYGKGVLTPSMVAWILSEAQKQSRPTVVDPKGADYSPYRGATVVTPNCQELSLAVGKPVKKTDPEGLAKAGQELMARHGLQNLLITRSEAGMTLLTGGGACHHLPTQAQAVYDVSGAGDTVMGVLTAALAAGADLLVGAELASRAAGVVVGKVGTAVATPEEIRNAPR